MTNPLYSQLSKFNDPESDESKDIQTLAKGIKTALEKSDDPLIKSALKAVNKKSYKKTGSDYFDGLSMLFKSAQIIRLADAMRALSDVPFTYGDVKSLYKWLGFPIGGFVSYTPKAKGFKFGDSDLIMPETSQQAFVTDLIKGLESLKLDLDNGSLLKWTSELAPKDGYFKDDKCGYKKKVQEKILSLGINKAEMDYTGTEFSAMIEMLELYADEEDYSAKTEVIAGFDAFLQNIQDNAARLITYFSAEDHPLENEAHAENLQTHLKALTAEKGLVPLITAFTQGVAHQQRSLEEYKEYKQLTEDGVFVNAFTGDIYDHLTVNARQEMKVIDFLECRVEGVAFDPNDSSVTELSEIYNEAAAINRKIAYLKSPSVDDVPKPYSINKTMDDLTALAERISLDVEQRMYCTLKQSGQYGDANLMAAFIAAGQARSDANDADAAPLQNPTAYLNELLKADLMMHGWDGEMPDAWREETTPSAADLVWMRNHPFTWLAPNDAVKPTLSAAEMDIEHDMNHRKTYFAKLIGYLQKARPMVGAKAQAEIDYGLTQLREEIIPAYQNALSDDHTHTENTNTEKGCTLS
ncbi:MAG: hypothetical protein CL561_13045 [Alphaproteobacteria bacterium]|nr:hypothetical protein [Alphaproteobacteria bacterium]